MKEFLTNLFCNPKISSDRQIRRIIRRLGYWQRNKKEFVKGQTYIWILEDGIKIKVYCNEYGESDFLENPITDKRKLIEFIKNNEL